MNAVVARWAGFLMQVQERFATIMREAQEGCPLLLAQAAFDPVPMGNAWGAMEMRARQLETKIEETWSDQVEGAFERAGATPDALAYERAKGDAMRANPTWSASTHASASSPTRAAPSSSEPAPRSVAASPASAAAPRSRCRSRSAR